MSGRIARLLHTLAAPRRRDDHSAPTFSPERPDRDEHAASVSRRLAHTLDRAMELGLWEHAERLAKSAVRLRNVSSQLAERLARLRLVQGRAETALAIIDSCSERPASLRLLRAACLIHQGRSAEAQLDLREWSLRSTAPLAARRLLALLEWDAGDVESAQHTLTRNLRHLEDPQTIEILLVMSVAQERGELTAVWAERLHAASLFATTGLETELLLTSVGIETSAMPATPTSTQIETLALELTSMESIIPTLVEAQRLKPEPARAALLYQAVIHALSSLTNELAACEALARLALILKNPAAALQWVQRGLKLNPMSVTLALLAQEAAHTAPDGPPDGAYGEEVVATIGESEVEAPVYRTGRAA